MPLISGQCGVRRIELVARIAQRLHRARSAWVAPTRDLDARSPRPRSRSSRAPSRRSPRPAAPSRPARRRRRGRPARSSAHAIASSARRRRRWVSPIWSGMTSPGKRREVLAQPREDRGRHGVARSRQRWEPRHAADRITLGYVRRADVEPMPPRASHGGLAAPRARSASSSCSSILVSLGVLVPGIWQLLARRSVGDPLRRGRADDAAGPRLGAHASGRAASPTENEGFRSKPVLTFWMMAAGMRAVGVAQGRRLLGRDGHDGAHDDRDPAAVHPVGGAWASR